MRLCRFVASSNFTVATSCSLNLHPHLLSSRSPRLSLRNTPFSGLLTPTCGHAPGFVKKIYFPSSLSPRAALGRPFLASRRDAGFTEHTRGLRSVVSHQKKRGSNSVSKRNGTPNLNKDSKMFSLRVQAKNENVPVVVEQDMESDDSEFEDDEEYDESLEEEVDEEFEDDLISDVDAELADENFDDIEETDADAFIDDMLEEEGEGVDDIQLGDGGDGGGVNLGQTPWGEKALMIAKEVLQEFGSNFSLYAFKSSPEGCIYVRLDKFTDKYGSPTMVEIESFSSIYGKRLEDAGQKGILPNNLALEVSSPGAERAVEVPSQLERFKDLPMLVRYVEETDATNPEVVKDSILTLESFEVESNKSVWKLANVRANRELAGKGRGLTRKQKEWRAELPLSSLRLVRLYMDI